MCARREGVCVEFELKESVRALANTPRVLPLPVVFVLLVSFERSSEGERVWASEGEGHGNNNSYRSIGFGGARRRWRSSRAAAEHGDAVRRGSAAAAADLRGGAEAAVARRGSAEGRPSSGTRRIGRVGRLGARSWRGLVACGAWQNKPRRRAHRVGRVYGRTPDVAGTSEPRVRTTSRRWT